MALGLTCLTRLCKFKLIDGTRTRTVLRSRRSALPILSYDQHKGLAGRVGLEPTLLLIENQAALSGLPNAPHEKLMAGARGKI